MNGGVRGTARAVPPVNRVAVDATAVPARLTGAGVYVARVLAELAARDDLELEVFCAPSSAGALAAPGLRLRPVRLAGAGRPARIAWTQLLAGRAARLAGPACSTGSTTSCRCARACPRWSPSTT